MTTSTRDQTWIAFGFASQFLSQAVRAVLLARILAPHDLGLYFVIRSAAMAVAILIPVGTGQAGMRRLATRRDNGPEATACLRAAVQVSTRSTVLIAPLVALVARSAGADVRDAVLIAAMAVALAWTAMLADLGRGLGRTTAVSSIERVLASLLETAVLAVPLLLGVVWGLTAVLAATLTAASVPVGLLARTVWRSAPRVEGARTAPTAGSDTSGLLAGSWPIAANALLWNALGQIDLWLVAALGNPQQAAIYGVALRLAVLLDFPKTIAAYQFAPEIARLHNPVQRGQLEHLLKRTARVTTLVSAAGFATILAIGASGLRILFGEVYTAALPIFAVLGVGRLVSAAAGLGGTTLLMTGRSKVLLQISAVSAGVTTVAALLLIPRVGALGAAAAATLGITVQCVLMHLAVTHYDGLNIHAGPGRR